MKILIVGINHLENVKLSEVFLKKLKDKYVTVDIWPGNQSLTNSEIKKREIDLLITFELQGFHYLTLTGGVAYNLLDCKQIHFLCGRELQNEHYLRKQLSIAMFFFCFGENYCNYLGDKYPEIPYLEAMNIGEDGQDVSVMSHVLEEAIDKVVQICKL